MYPDGATFEPASGKCWAEFGWDYIDAGHGNGDKYVSCSFHPNVCTFILGESHLDEGVGEKEEYIGNFDTPRECVAEVLQWNYGRKHGEQIANGVTWGTYKGVIGIGSTVTQPGSRAVYPPSKRSARIARGPRRASHTIVMVQDCNASKHWIAITRA